MNRIEKVQLSFEKGMVETFKQNTMDQQNVFNSVLWLENYNPNLEHRSALKRWGILAKRDMFGNGLIKPKTLDDTEIRVSDLCKDFEDNSDDTGEFLRCSTILKTSNPDVNDTYVMFLSRNIPTDADPHYEFQSGEKYEGTMVYGYVWEYDDNGKLWKPRFRESWNEGDEYPGWCVLGSFQDFCKYGESIAFVTKYLPKDDNISQIIKYFYPIYIWKLWDITKKRDDYPDQFWNGLGQGDMSNLDSISDKRIFKNWIVKTPSLKLLRESSAGAMYIENPGQSLQTWKDVTTGNTLVDVNPSGNTLYPGIKPIELLIWEKPIYKNKYMMNRDSHLYEGLWNDLSLFYEKLVTTWETFKIDSIKNDMVNHINGWSVQSYGSDAHHEYYTKPEIMSFYDDKNNEYEIIKGVVWHAQPDPYDHDHIIVAIPTMLPSYIDSQMPRPWFDVEIPLLMTIDINGIEYIIYKGNYKTQHAQILDIAVTCPGELEFRDLTKSGMDTDSAYALNISRPYISKKDYITPRVLNSWESSQCFTLKWYTVQFTLRIDRDIFKDLLSLEANSINLYVSKPDPARHIIRSVGASSYNPVPGCLYSFPIYDKANAEDYSNYALIKKFLIEGRGDHVNDWKEYRGETINTNSWKYKVDAIGHSYYAMPQKDGSNWPDVKEIGTTTDFDPTKDSTSMDDEWTPDFLLWDYPQDSPPLLLQSSGKYLECLGAGLTCNIKGMNFIGKVKDKDGYEVQAKIYYPQIQSGVISPDIFPKENFVDVGHQPHTAILEYREQLWIFNRQSFYRILIHNVAQPETWEFLEALHGQGTFHPKTVAVTPYGVAFANENGIWMSDGRNPQSLTDNANEGFSVSAIFQKLMTNRYYQFHLLHDPGEVITEEGYNKYAELVYDELNDELVLITPVGRKQVCSYDFDVTYPPESWHDFTHEIRLVFSFQARNWRIESYEYLKRMTTGDNQFGLIEEVKTACKTHRIHFANPSIEMTRMYYVSFDESWWVDIGTQDKRYLRDFWRKFQADDELPVPIQGIIITHEVGDGKDDALLHSILLETSGRDNLFNDRIRWDGVENDDLPLLKSWWEYAYDGKDPQFAYSLRNSQFANETFRMYDTQNGISAYEWMDLMVLNMNAKAPDWQTATRNPFLTALETPGGINTEEVYKDPAFITINRTAGNESLILLAPLRTKFRDSRYKLCSDILTKIKSFNVRYAVFPRRSQ